MLKTVIAKNFTISFGTDNEETRVSCEWDLYGRETIQTPDGDVLKSPIYKNDESENTIKTIVFSKREGISQIAYYNSNSYVDQRIIIDVATTDEFIEHLKDVIRMNLVGTFTIDFESDDFDYGLSMDGDDMIMKNKTGKVNSVSASFSQKYDSFTVRDNFYLREDLNDKNKYKSLIDAIKNEMSRFNIYFSVAIAAIAYAYVKHV